MGSRVLVIVENKNNKAMRGSEWGTRQTIGISVANCCFGDGKRVAYQLPGGRGEPLALRGSTKQIDTSFVSRGWRFVVNDTETVNIRRNWMETNRIPPQSSVIEAGRICGNGKGKRKEGEADPEWREMVNNKVGGGAARVWKPGDLLEAGTVRGARMTWERAAPSVPNKYK